MKLVENLDSKTFEKKFDEDKDAVHLDIRNPMDNQMVTIPSSILIDISDSIFNQDTD